MSIKGTSETHISNLDGPTFRSDFAHTDTTCAGSSTCSLIPTRVAHSLRVQVAWTPLCTCHLAQPSAGPPSLICYLARRSLSCPTALSPQALSRPAGSPSPLFNQSYRCPLFPIPPLSRPVTRSPLTRRVYTIGTTTLQAPTRSSTEHELSP